MESTTRLVGLHEASGPSSSSLRARQTGQNRDPSSSKTTSSSSSSLLQTARSAKAMANTTRSRTWQLMTLAAFITAGWTFYFIFANPNGYDGYPLAELQRRMLSFLTGRAHVWGGGISMALGPFQYLASLRRTGKLPKKNTRTSIHSWIGRVYNVCVVAAGIGSLDIVHRSDLYPFGTRGFQALGLAWIVTALCGWIAMWGEKPNIESHKKWMTANFSLTYAAVMLRWQLPLLLRFGWPLKFALSFSGWLCWVPNLIFVALL